MGRVRALGRFPVFSEEGEQGEVRTRDATEQSLGLA
jgi:hypothetical protein